MIGQFELAVGLILNKLGVDLSVEGAHEGQGLVEYALIIVLVSIACVVTLTALGTSIGGVFTQITGSL
jgi:pilus assembly protein Flp/PilA